MTIFNHTLKRICSSKIKLAVIFLCPLLFITMFMTTTRSALSLLVVDNDGTALSGRLAHELGALGGKVDVKLVSEEAVDDRILSYQSDEALILPKGFEADILAGRTPAVGDFHILDAEGVYYANAYVDGFVSDMLTLAEGAGHDRAAFEAALAAYDRNGLGVQDMSGANINNTWAYGSLGMIAQFMLYMSIITAGIILEDRSSGVYYRTFFAPVTLKRYLAENLAAFTIIGVLQAAISITLLIAIYGIRYGDLLAVYVLFAVFAVVCIALGMWLITLFKKPMMAYLSILFLTTPLVMLGGCYWPTSYMPDMIVKIAKFLPTSWVMQAADKVINQGAGLGGIGLELLVLLLFAAIFMAAGLAKKVDVAK